MTLFIQGLAVPLNVKNKNGWGIPETETANVINSLKASVLKICPGEAHACDYSGDPNGRIGVFDSAWAASEGVYAKYKVTDSVAERKLKEGTWQDLKWSMFGDSKNNPVMNDGWANGVNVKTMTLVRNPAWDQAHYQVAASEENGITELRLFSEFQLIASKEGDEITTDDELKAAQTKIAELEKTISASALTIDDLEGQVTTLKASVTEKETELSASVAEAIEAKTKITELTASNEKLTTELGAKTTLVASLEKDKAGSVPMDQLKSIIAAAIEEHDSQLKAVNARDDAFKLFASARESLGLETKPEDFSTLSAADLTKLAQDLGTVKVSAAQIRYPANNNVGSTDCAIGAYDAKAGGWK